MIDHIIIGIETKYICFSISKNLNKSDALIPNIRVHISQNKFLKNMIEQPHLTNI